MSEIWLDFNGNVDKDKYYDIQLGNDGSIQFRCYYEKSKWGDHGFTNADGWWNYNQVDQYKESEDQGEESEAEDPEQQFNISVKSTALAHALTHSKGNLDSMIEGILVTMLGDYEAATDAKDWNTKQHLFARNAFRKVAKQRLKQWFEGELVQ